MKLLLPYLLCATAFAQPTSNQTFEAADVQTSKSTASDLSFLANHRIEARGVTMLRLISTAYSIPVRQITGGPSWIDTDTFDITAKAPGAATQIAMRNMLQNLLAERFHLVAKNEERPMPAFVLTVVKKGMMKAAAPNSEPGCKRDFEEGVLALACRNMTMSSLAETLPQMAPGYFSLPTVNKTGLEGGFDIQLSWKGRQQISGPSDPMSLFNVIEKTLGVKAEQQTAPTPVVTVVSVDRTPTPNPAGTTDIIGKPPTTFDVVNIKLSRPDEKEDFRLVNGLIEAKAVRLREMLAFAYNVEDDWVRGSEKMIDNERYDILAKTAPTEAEDVIRVMVVAALEDRFKLKVHREMQPMAVYGLTVNKSKLKEADPSGRSTCTRVPETGAVSLRCTNYTMEQFAKRIRNEAGGYFEHPVVDLTGLKGAYDFTVSWAPKQRIFGNGPRVEGGGGDSVVPVASDRPVGLTIFEAVDRQLGLKLATVKHPMQVVVVDHIERPTGN
jgi:uncharacterized protein (TIGR03435 family)